MNAKRDRGLVLIVEDMPGSRWMVEELLGRAGFDTFSVKNGAEALYYLESKRRPNLIVLDLSMPVMDGWEFLHQLSDEFLSIPVVLHSGDPFVSEDRYAGTNVVAFVPKSETTGKLVTVVEETIEKRRAG